MTHVRAMLFLSILTIGGCKQTQPPTTSAPSVPAPKQEGWRVGDDIDVEWRGEWFQASVLEVSGDRLKIHYVGYESGWDEVVGPERVRARTATARRGGGSR